MRILLIGATSSVGRQIVAQLPATGAAGGWQWGAAIGQPALVTSTVAEITGTPARTFREWAIGHAAEFRA